MHSHYQTLELRPGATKEEVKKAFRRLAHIHHPDKGGTAAKFNQISTAYRALVNSAPDVGVGSTETGESFWSKSAGTYTNQQEWAQRHMYEDDDVVFDSEDQARRAWEGVKTATEAMQKMREELARKQAEYQKMWDEICRRYAQRASDEFRRGSWPPNGSA